MKNSLIIDENGLLEMFSSTDDGTNSLEVNETEIPSSSWVGSGNYTFTIGEQTYTIAKASSSTGNWQLIQDSDYAFHFQRVLTMREEFLNLAYPVGSIYMSVNATNPETLFGGSWERISGQFLLGATDGGATGTSIKSRSDAAPGASGGEASHTLSEGELPSIVGTFDLRRWGTAPGNVVSATTGKFSSSITSGTSSNTVGVTSTAATTQKITHQFGSGQGHNNMPPFLSVYIWKRTA